MDYPQSLTNADILGQGNLDLVREKSGKCQGILLSIICGNPDIDVSDTLLQYWMLIAGFRCLRCMGGSRKFCLGVGCPENFILVFFTEGRADLASLSKQLDLRGPTSSRGCQ